MPNPLLLDIITYLTNNKIVEGDGVDAFRDFTPDEPDNVVVLNEYQGSPPLFYEESVHRSVQVCVRNIDADIARATALKIYKLMQSKNSVINFTEDRWGQVSLRQPPFKIDMSEKERTTYSFNMGITTTIE